MKIEFWYDPVYTETHLRINENWQNGLDMYGFLYPVRRYPLQTWLRAAGSWPGIAQQLRDISRGEKIELEFHGRDIDYQDLFSEIGGMEGIELICEEWDVFSVYNDKVCALEKSLQEIGTYFPFERTVAARIVKLSKKQPDEGEWMVSVVSLSDLQYAEKDSRLCCRVDGGMLDCLERLADIGRLTRSLRRPSDAVCCCFSDTEGKESFESYASQFPGMRYRFVLDTEQRWKETLWQKYGKAGWMRGRLQEGADLCEDVLKLLDRQQLENNKNKMELVHKRMEGENLEKELDSCMELSSKLHAYQKTWQGLKLSMAEHHPKDLWNLQ